MSIARPAPEPEVLSRHLVVFTGLFYQDFSNAFLNLWKAISFLGALWQGVSQFNCKLCEEPLYITLANLAFASFTACPLVLVFRKARKARSRFTFSTALVISQPSVSALPSLHASSIHFPVMLQAIFIALVWTSHIPENTSNALTNNRLSYFQICLSISMCIHSAHAGIKWPL